MGKIHSMTGFVSEACAHAGGTLVWDIRSINHRFLEVNVRLPELFRSMGPLCRERVKQCLKRGKVDLVLSWQPDSDAAPMYQVNAPVLEALAEAYAQIKTVFPQAELSATELLRWQGVLQKDEVDLEALSPAIMSALDQALEGLLASRAREGRSIQICLQGLLTEISGRRQLICDKMPFLVAEQRARIAEKANDLSVELDSGRLEQELLFMLNKQDVAEEMQRLESHILEAVRVVNAGGVVGRRLDFLMQEFNREANTTASKSVDRSVTQAVVDMKVLIEQIREQVQNIE